MAIRRRAKNFVISGGILTIDFLLNLQEEEPKQPLIKPNTFNIPPNLIVKNQNQLDTMIKESWERLLEKWDEISIKLKSMNESDSKQKWTIPLLKALDFIDIQYSSKDIAFEDGKIQVFISHRGWARADAPKIHIVGPSQELDSRLDTDRNNKSPHDSLQLYLKLDKSPTKWGIVTNGLQIRLLRDFFHTHTRGYVEFDMESIFYERNFTDFRTLYRLIHASRFLKDENNQIILDKFYEESVAAGTKIGEGLRENVKKAIELIGNGLLTHEMRKLMTSKEDITKEFYQEILRIIYRTLFLMFAEQRGMLPMHNSLYVEEYSITKLRERAETRIVSDNHSDLWHGLFATFSLIKNGSDELDVFGYNGDLFNDSTLKYILKLECRNDLLLRAIKYLTLYEKGKVLQRINFLDLGVEEIGAIYESLLDFTPRILDKDEKIISKLHRKGEFILDPRGVGRKTTGSYYTDSRLINELINSALKPIIEKIVKNENMENEEKERSLLELKICDPACGSGAFLIAANNYLGKELAKIRTETEYPSESTERKSRREILSKCIYGVDLNPMAVELAKVSLWINASVKDLPLNFLDHHIKCGNSLIGTNNQRVRKGILDDSFTPIIGEDKKNVQQIKKANQFQKKYLNITKLDSYFKKEDFILIDRSLIKKIENMEENTVEQIQKKKELYSNLVGTRAYKNQILSYDTWISSFFWPFNEMIQTITPTNSMFKSISDGSTAKGKSEVISKVKELSKKYRFFNWELEFPEIFGKHKPGFDCILGNPPWERVKLQEKEFFEARIPRIAKAKNASQRKKMIKEELKKNESLAEDYNAAQMKSRKTSHFLRNSSIFPYTGVGDVNTYSVFAERIISLLSETGRAGIIVPTGIATDYYTQDFFNHLITSQQLISLYDFENRKKIFPDVHGSYKFSLLSLGGEKSSVKESSFAFFLHDPEELKDTERIFALDLNDFKRLNPNTLTCPIYRTRKDAEIIKKIYQKIPVLINKTNEMEINRWEIQFLRLIDMTNDSKHFRKKEDLERNGFILNKNNEYIKLKETFSPLYEGRMIDIYDHRASSVGEQEETTFRSGITLSTEIFQYKNTEYISLPRYWIKKQKVETRIPNEYRKNWFFGFKNVTSSTNRRTFIGTIIPRTAVGNSVPLILSLLPVEKTALLFANMSSIIFDYIARQKIGGINMNFYLIEQLPIIPYEHYTKEIREKIIDYFTKLNYTSIALKVFAEDIRSTDTKPFIWNEEERLLFKAELDAIYANLYQLDISELEYIIETFPIIKKLEIKKYKEYKSKRLIIEFFEKHKILRDDKNEHI